MKKLLVAIGVLDLLLFIQVLVVGHFFYSWSAMLGDPVRFASNLGRGAMMVSLLFTAYGFIRAKTWVFWLAYAQVPLRLLIGTFTFAFLNLIVHLLHDPSLYRPISQVAMTLEVLKTVVLVVLHVRLTRAARA